MQPILTPEIEAVLRRYMEIQQEERRIQGEKRSLQLALFEYDIEAHENKLETLIRKLRNWLCTTLGCDLPAATAVWYRFTDFLTNIQLQLEREGYSLRDIDEMPTPEFIRKIRSWRREN